MMTCKGYVIATLTMVCFTAAWPQQRSTQATNRNQDDLDRVIWGSEDGSYVKSMSTPVNSANIPRPGATKSNNRRSQRLQSEFHLSEQDNDTIPQQQQQRNKNQSERRSGVQRSPNSTRQQRNRNNTSAMQDEARQSNTTRGVLAVSARAISSHQQQDLGRPVFQPRAHQSPVNRTRQPGVEGAVEGTRTQIGGSGGTSARGTTGNATLETAPETEVRKNVSRDDTEVAASQNSGARSRHVDPTAAERNLPRWGNKGTRVKLPSESSIVFPGPSQDNKHTLPFLPRVVGERPICASGEDTFCTDSNKEYPNVHLNRILEQQSVVFRNFFTTDVIPEANSIAQRFDDNDNPLCLSETKIVFPKQAQNKENEWLYIVNLNDDEYKQGVRIEKCSTPDMPCAYSEGFPLSIETSCKQKYIYRQMLAVSQDGTPKPDSFKLPSCCACHTRSMGAMARMGMINPDTQTPAPKRKRRQS